MFHEMQTSEAWRCTNSLQQIFKRKECQIENVDSHIRFRQRKWEYEPC
jgi:hypothetical protein